MAAGSPSGMVWRSRSRARSSLSRVSPLMVIRTRYRSAASGATIARREGDVFTNAIDGELLASATVGASSTIRSASVSAWAGAGEFANARRNIGLRMQTGDKTLDVTLAHVPRGIEHGLVILIGEVAGEQRDGRERHGAVGQEREDDRKVPRRTRGRDAGCTRPAPRVENLRAIGEERRIALT